MTSYCVFEEAPLSPELKSSDTFRVYIRPPRQSDIDAFLAYRNDPASMTQVGAAPLSVDGGLELLTKQMSKVEADPGWRMFMIVRKEDDRVIGETGAFLRLADEREADIGWWLHPDCRGKGYATEAAKLIVAWCLQYIRVDLVTSTCLADNLASRKVMQRIGMEQEEAGPNANGVDEYRAIIRANRAAEKR